MEGDEQQRRQYEQPSYPRGFVPDLRGASGSGIPDVLDPRAGPEDDGTERFRQSQLLTARTPATASMNPVGPNPPDLGGYGYTQGQQYPTPQMQGTSLQYPSDYSQDPQRQQQFPHYTPQMMYNDSPQTQHESPYDAVPQYQPRQSAAVAVLPTQFGVPQYYNAGETTSAPDPSSIVQQYVPSQFHPPLIFQPSAPITPSTVTSTYTPGMADLPPTSALTAEEVGAQDPVNQAFDRAYGEYQNALRQTFVDTRDGKLAKAGRSLLSITDWLLGAAGELGRKDRCLIFIVAELWAGLIQDDETLHAQRIQLWDEFNTCWLAVLQRQKESTQDMLDSGQPPIHPQTLISEDDLETMGNELVRHCDVMERHGLVDYQMGVWEEEIISSEH